MMLRFRYGNVNDEYEYQDNQLHAIDSYLAEDQIRRRFADTYRSCQTGRGRTPLDPVIAYKAHLLYFLKRDIISFNQLPEQISDKADYRVARNKKNLYNGLIWTGRTRCIYMTAFSKTAFTALNVRASSRYLWTNMQRYWVFFPLIHDADVFYCPYVV